MPTKDVLHLQDPKWSMVKNDSLREKMGICLPAHPALLYEAPPEQALGWFPAPQHKWDALPSLALSLVGKPDPKAGEVDI